MMEKVAPKRLQGIIDTTLDCRRGYTATRYLRILDNIRRHMPNASISGDAIVGFPGETEEQFEATCRSAPFTATSLACDLSCANMSMVAAGHQSGIGCHF